MAYFASKHTIKVGLTDDLECCYCMSDRLLEDYTLVTPVKSNLQHGFAIKIHNLGEPILGRIEPSPYNGIKMGCPTNKFFEFVDMYYYKVKIL